MKTLAYTCLYVVLLICAVTIAHGQKDGIRGYGNLEFMELNTLDGKNYTSGGGGVIINNNLILGVYVSTLTRPFRWDLFEVTSNPALFTDPLSTNPLVINTTIAHFDVGGKVGFNIAPAKSFQATLAMKFGYATINYNESFIDESVDLANPDLVNLPVIPLSITRNNFNVSPQIELQFKIGRAFKISVIGGYKWHRSTIANRTLFPNIDNLLADNNLLGGGYTGLGFTFGNL